MNNANNAADLANRRVAVLAARDAAGRHTQSDEFTGCEGEVVSVRGADAEVELSNGTLVWLNVARLQSISSR